MIGQRAIVEVPGQRGGNVTICAAISNHGVLHHHVTLGQYDVLSLLVLYTVVQCIVGCIL